MNIFVVHKGSDFDKCQNLIKRLKEQNIFISDKYMYVKLHENNSCSNKRPIFLEIDFDKFCNLASDGYDFYIKDEIDRTDNPKRMEDLVAQYQMYVQTSEAIIERRQAISSFYVGVNTTIITAITTIISILVGTDILNNKPLSIGIIMLVSSLLSIILNSNWYLQLESYGKLNSAKMKVISALEKQMPANIFDTEWRVMSSKIGGKKYRSFTNIEKTVPTAFLIIFIVTTCIALGLIINGFC